MIKSFKCKDTLKIWEGIFSKKFPPEIQNRALIKLRQIDVSLNLEDLINPPSNHLEALSGNRKGQFSVRINDQWRICFKFADGEAMDVEIVDYH